MVVVNERRLVGEEGESGAEERRESVLFESNQYAPGMVRAFLRLLYLDSFSCRFDDLFLSLSSLLLITGLRWGRRPQELSPHGSSFRLSQTLLSSHSATFAFPPLSLPLTFIVLKGL